MARGTTACSSAPKWAAATAAAMNSAAETTAAPTLVPWASGRSIAAAAMSTQAAPNVASATANRELVVSVSPNEHLLYRDESSHDKDVCNAQGSGPWRTSE